MTLPLSGLLVVSLEQAVAAPMCTCRLADAGARVIKIERPEGDFARGYDDLVHGESTLFRLAQPRQGIGRARSRAAPTTRRCSRRCSRKADVFVQNLKPGAVGKARLSHRATATRASAPDLLLDLRLSARAGPTPQRKAYDMLIQAESGLASVTGGPEAPSRVGVSVVDIAAGHERLRGDPGSADRARAHRRGRGDFDLDVRRHGGLDDGAAAATRKAASRRSASASRIRRSRPTARSSRATASTF